MVPQINAPSCRNHIHQKGLGISIIVAVVLAILSQTSVVGAASAGLLITAACLPITPIIYALLKYGLAVRRFRQAPPREEEIIPDPLPLPTHFEKNDPRLNLVPPPGAEELPEDWAGKITQEAPGVYSTQVDNKTLRLTFPNNREINITYIHLFIEAYKSSEFKNNPRLVHIAVMEKNIAFASHPIPKCATLA